MSKILDNDFVDLLRSIEPAITQILPTRIKPFAPLLFIGIHYVSMVIKSKCNVDDVIKLSPSDIWNTDSAFDGKISEMKASHINVLNRLRSEASNGN